MNSGPELKFQLDKELDRWTAKEFLTFKEDDIFSDSILRDHPELDECRGMEPSKRDDFIKKYIGNYYAEHKGELEDALGKAEVDWARIACTFFELTDKLFSKDRSAALQPYNWPKGNYVCYLSIFNCNPRFIKEKEFQAYYRHDLTVNYVCVHEMLHFIFYDYLENNFSEEYKRPDEEAIWKLSEVFNDVILRLPEFVALTKQPDPPIYAQTKEELKKYQSMWQQSPGVHPLLKGISLLIEPLSF